MVERWDANVVTLAFHGRTIDMTSFREPFLRFWNLIINMPGAGIFEFSSDISSISILKHA